MTIRSAATFALAAILSVAPAAAQDIGQETTAQRDARMAWWRDARFGMFIHWGAYAVAAGTYKGERIPGIGEWIMSHAHVPIPEYEEFVHRFNPVRFDPDEWVRIAKDAGMKYIIITSKHHDGFAIFDSKVSRYDIVDATPYKRDALKALAQAAHRAGMRFGVYYSIMDWHHPDAQGPNAPEYNSTKWSNPNFGRYVEAYMKPQLQELLTQYPEIDVLWFDGRLERRARAGSVRLRPRPAAGSHREQPRGAHASGLERPESGGTDRAGRLRDPRAAGAPRGASRRRLGNLHDDERHVGLQVVRRRLEGHAHPTADADRRGV